MKRQKFLRLTAAALAVSMLLAGCGGGEKNGGGADIPAGSGAQSQASFVVHFDSKGGSKVADMTAQEGEPLKLPAPPTKEDCKFLSWEDSHGTTIYDGADNIVNTGGSLTLYAVWQDLHPAYTVHFDSKGGSKVADMTAQEGKPLKLPKAPSREGYQFLSWADRHGTVIYDGADNIVNTGGSLTLYANWKNLHPSYTVHFDSKGGSKVKDITAYEGKPLQLPKAPTREGYRFMCWADRHETPIYDGAKMVNTGGSMTLYANWKNLHPAYTVHFDSKGGSKVKDITAYEGKPLKLPKNPTREGYQFLSWADSHGTVIYDGADNIVNTGGSLTLYANWKNLHPAYTVHFDSKGGSKVKDITAYEGKPLKLPKAPTREGYRFMCWADRHETPIYDGAKMVNTGGSITLHAVWEEQIPSYVIHFDSDGGTPVADITVKEGEPIHFPAPPTREGYTFGSWYDQHGMTIYEGTTLTDVRGHLYLTADWIKK